MPPGGSKLDDLPIRNGFPMRGLEMTRITAPTPAARPGWVYMLLAVIMPAHGVAASRRRRRLVAARGGAPVSGDANPQAEQMAHESMQRTLAAQARAIWPQERRLLERYDLPAPARLLDVGCGTGEIVRRLAEWRPDVEITGVDLHADHVERARATCAAFGDRVRLRVGDAFHLELPDDAFDLVLCRHLLQAVPRPERVVAEMKRVARPGAWLHVVAEDYGMMHFHPTRHDADRFWREGPMRFAERTGTDLRSGRKMYTIMRRGGLADVQVEYVIVDTLRVPREIFAEIWIAWRDGYAAAIAEHTDLTYAVTVAAFDDMIAAIRDPDGYAAWKLPVISGRKSEGKARRHEGTS